VELPERGTPPGKGEPDNEEDLMCAMQIPPGAEPSFPDPRRSDARGLVAVGGDFSVARLLEAYRSGVFPWTANPISWWSPDPRAIFELERVHVPRSLARTLRQEIFRVTMDAAFEAVIAGCAAPDEGRGETWISAEFREAYARLHREGHAHSVECWSGGELAGGIYGVAVGGLFAGESMFHRRADASKVALVHLARHLRARSFTLFDIQMLTPITRQLGAVELARTDYLQRLAGAVRQRCEF
jgi:leucyl/phenylalanyl-tRNA--protein transferase